MILIMIEGADGTGKTTLATALCNKIKGSVYIKRPKKSVYDDINTKETLKDFKKHLRLSIKDERAFINEVIKLSKDKKNKMIISDRSYISGIVYPIITLLNEGISEDVDRTYVMEKLYNEYKSLNYKLYKILDTRYIFLMHKIIDKKTDVIEKSVDSNVLSKLYKEAYKLLNEKKSNIYKYDTYTPSVNNIITTLKI